MKMLSSLLLYPMLSILWTTVKGSRLLTKSNGLVRRSGSRVVQMSSSSLASMFPPMPFFPRMIPNFEGNLLSPKNARDEEQLPKGCPYSLESCSPRPLGATISYTVDPTASPIKRTLMRGVSASSNADWAFDRFSLKVERTLHLRNNLVEMLKDLHGTSSKNAIQSKSKAIIAIAEVVDANKHELRDYKQFQEQIRLARRILRTKSLPSILSLAKEVGEGGAYPGHYKESRSPRLFLNVTPGKIIFAGRTSAARLIHFTQSPYAGSNARFLCGTRTWIVPTRPGDIVCISYHPGHSDPINYDHLLKQLMDNEPLQRSIERRLQAGARKRLMHAMMHTMMQKYPELSLFALIACNQ